MTSEEIKHKLADLKVGQEVFVCMQKIIHKGHVTWEIGGKVDSNDGHELAVRDNRSCIRFTYDAVSNYTVYHGQTIIDVG